LAALILDITVEPGPAHRRQLQGGRPFHGFAPQYTLA
jgi:hypothetical protein